MVAYGYVPPLILSVSPQPPKGPIARIQSTHERSEVQTTGRRSRGGLHSYVVGRSDDRPRKGRG